MPDQPLPSPRILLGPGPLSVSPRVMLAMAQPPIGYLDPELFGVLEEIQNGLRTVFGTANAFTLALTGTGMAGMESCFANLVEPGDTVVIGVNGFFGGRMVEIATRYGANAVRVDAEWGDIVDPDRVAVAAAEAGKVKLIACVHAETSTGVLQPLEPIAEVARRHDALFVVDAVTSLGGLPVQVDGAGIDACYSASQKCMGCPPGLAPLTVSDRAFRIATRQERASQTISWYYDWRLLDEYWGGSHAYHHTVPVNNLFGLRESLRAILEEGLDARFTRHRQASAALMSGMAALGLAPFAIDGHRLPTLNTVRIPQGVEDAPLRKRLLAEYGIEIGGGLGDLKGRIVRIGTMGESATRRNVELLLGAVKRVLTAND
jgi:alanine-glyoxylate transaminase/serine-glyoxylate transaminase/serine-pyruvate transaminase